MQVNKSLAARPRLSELEGEKMQQINKRDTEDATTMSNIPSIVAGLVVDLTEAANSALDEATGYVRKEDSKSGLTRKRVQPVQTV